MTLARELAAGILRGLGVATACIDDVRLVVSEACTNAVKYATRADDYHFRMGVDGLQCTIEVLDSGQGFDLAAVSEAMPPPDAPSGRGVALMRYLTDDLEVRSDPVHGTTVRMAKRLRMEWDGGLEGHSPGPSDGHVSGEVAGDGPVRAAYDSNPPKPPR